MLTLHITWKPHAKQDGCPSVIENVIRTYASQNQRDVLVDIKGNQMMRINMTDVYYMTEVPVPRRI